VRLAELCNVTIVCKTGCVFGGALQLEVRAVIDEALKSGNGSYPTLGLAQETGR
jgi:hypothetical protein